jgi:cyclopropane-fatty-acyl-phospholipid synthase
VKPVSPIAWAEKGWMPDPLIRAGIRRLLRRRLAELRAEGGAEGAAYTEAFADRLRNLPIAEAPDEANRQHYELPPRFFACMLGPRLKYSACYYPRGDETLGEAEEGMLGLTCARAGVQDGMQILELGCGWGSLTLWMAVAYPDARITALTNSALQADHVSRRAREAGLDARLEVIREDVNAFAPRSSYDRIVSVEMLEHVRNYHHLFGRLRGWLRPDGRLFVHVFSHRAWPYLFETAGEDNWMGRHFFSGGTMPSHDLLPRLAEGLRLERDWRINGRHYARTLEAWLARLDRRRGEALEVLAEHHGPKEARVRLQRWRMFLMACAELFAFRQGEEWGVSHLLFAGG